MDLELLLAMASSFDADRVAVSDLDGGSLTTGRLDEIASGAATIFRDAGQARVAFCDTNGLAFPVTLFGAVKARMPFVPLNYRLSDEQLGQIATDEQLTVVASKEQGDRLRSLGIRHVIESSELLRSAPTTAPPGDVGPAGADEVAVLLYTSGTTGAPKAAILRHRHLAAYVINTVEFGSATSDDATLLSVPPYHIAGVMNLLSNLYMGRRIVYLDAFSPERWLEGVKEHGVTHAMVVPTMLSRIVTSLGSDIADLPSLRTISYGGARMPRSVIEKALRLFPEVGFTNAYGLTETSSTISLLGPETHRQALESDDPAVSARLGSVGIPLPGIEIQVRDDTGKSCGPGESGDIFVRGEQVAGEYVGPAKAASTAPAPGDSTTGEPATEEPTADKADEAAWFATRDLGYLDDAGYLFVEGRADDTIIRGGENISPVEIEEVLLAHPDVTDCAVVGIDDEEWGQRIAAAVVLTAGASVSAEELKALARLSLRGAKAPELVVVVSELPYTDTGKLLRRAVRDDLQKAPPLSQPARTRTRSSA